MSEPSVLDVPDASPETLPVPIGDDGVGATGFLLNLIAQENSGLVLGEDGFYFQIQDQAGVEALLKMLDAITGGGFLVNDFQYGHVLDFVIENKTFPDGKMRLGGSLAPLDPNRFEVFEKAIICDDNEAYFEFLPGAPVPAERDEFLALLWKFGIKFGIDTASLAVTLAEGATKPGKYLVARAIPAIEGSDAKPVPKVNFQRQRTIKEADAAGHADLHFYECGFPQVSTGPGPHALLEKKPAVPGRAGRSVGGKRLDPQPIKDFDLARMAGAGTRVMEMNGNQTVVTDNGGYFIDVDAQQQISVSPHAKNSFPIGPKTGSFEVTGERFEQCGDIEHQYLLIAQHIDIKSGSVRGKVISKSGHVLIVGTIENGGQVEAEGGDVTVETAVLGGRIVALAGKIAVKRAEGSVLIAREVVVEDSAINCFIIADVIRIKKAAGISFYAQNVTLGQLDLTDANANPVAGYIVLRDNLNARKTIRRFEKRQRRLDKVEQMETLVREQGLGEAWTALDARLSEGTPLSPEETRLFGPLLKPCEYVRRRREMAAKDRAVFADPKYLQQYQAAELAVTQFEASMSAAVGLSIQNITYPADLTALIAGAGNADPMAALNAAPQAFYAYVSSDPTLAGLAKREKKLQHYFLAFVSRMLAGTVMHEARIRPLRSLALLKSPCVFRYQALKALAHPDDPGWAADERRHDSARIEIHRDVVIPVVVDGYSVGRLRNVSDHGASVMFDDTQDNPPVFEKLEEVQMVIQPGYIVESKGGKPTQRPLTAWEEQRYPFSITAVIENDSAGLVKISGYYAHMNEDALNRARRLRTQIEALMMRLAHEA
jgi:hypothetical protein